MSPSSPRSTTSSTSSLPEVDLTGPTTHALDRLRPASATNTPFATATAASFSSPAVNLNLSADMARFHRSTPQSFTQATRRLLQRERVVHRDQPDVAVERVQLAEISPANPARESALRHGARAYAAVGYMHALLAGVVTLIATLFLVAVARDVASDVARKTRERASEFAATAADCEAKLADHQCTVEGDRVTHRSAEIAPLCRGWATCAAGGQFAQQDARSAKVWAETLADTGNAFAERVSSTTMVISLAFLLLVVFLVSSAAFNFLHRRVAGDAMHGVVHAPGSVSASPAPSAVRVGGTPVRRAIKFDMEEEADRMLTPRRRGAR